MGKESKVGLVFLFLCIAAIFAILFFFGKDAVVLYPKGNVGVQERDLVVISTILMLIVVIPVFVLMFFFCWKYRSGNTKAKYAPDADYNLLAESIWWGLPCAIVLALSIIGWKSCHDLDPYKPLDGPKKAMTIQVVALQWKWLFIYPEQKIATVNFLQFPEKTPIHFDITADSPMNSFWIPQLGGQIFAMPGMKTTLYLIADEVGLFKGYSANISGTGFAGMVFTTKASKQEEFEAWAASIQQEPKFLGIEEYTQIAKPSSYSPVESYVLKEENLYDWIVMKYMRK